MFTFANCGNLLQIVATFTFAPLKPESLSQKKQHKRFDIFDHKKINLYQFMKNLHHTQSKQGIRVPWMVNQQQMQFYIKV